MKDNNLYYLFDSILKKNNEVNSSESDMSSSVASALTDKMLEYNLRLVLEKNLPVTKYEEQPNLIKEFKIYKIDLFNSKTRELIKSNLFLADANYYYLELENEYFFISNDDLSSLNYYDSKTKKSEKIIGFEETQQLPNNSTTLFLQNEDINKILEYKNDDGAFFNDIKLNLLSDKTLNFIGNINNIPKSYLDNYYVKGKLLSYGQYPYAICLGRDKESKPSTGIIHYPMQNYYIKLALRKGQFDGVYLSRNELELSIFKCEIIYNTFNKIPKDKFILFEFKNGNGGEDKLIIQAVNYQENAKVLLENKEFYHLIIIRSKKLKKALEKKKERIISKNLANFAILCLNNELEICGKKLKETQQVKVDAKKTGSKSSKKMESSSCSKSKSQSKETQENNNSLLSQIMNELREMKSQMSGMKSQMSGMENQMKKIQEVLQIKP